MIKARCARCTSVSMAEVTRELKRLPTTPCTSHPPPYRPLPSQVIRELKRLDQRVPLDPEERRQRQNPPIARADCVPIAV